MIWFFCMVLVIIGFISGCIYGMHKQRKEDLAEFKQLTKDLFPNDDIKYGGF